MFWLAQSGRVLSRGCRFLGSNVVLVMQTFAKGAQDQTFRSVISPDLFLAVQCCGLRSSLDRNHHSTHPHATARGGSPPSNASLAGPPVFNNLRCP